MDSVYFIRFQTKEARENCLYYLDADNILPFPDEVEVDEAERIESAERMPTLNIQRQGERECYLDIELDDAEPLYWQLNRVRDFILQFAPEFLVAYVDDLGDCCSVIKVENGSWLTLYNRGDDALVDEQLEAQPNTNQGWHQRLNIVLGKQNT